MFHLVFTCFNTLCFYVIHFLSIVETKTYDDQWRDDVFKCCAPFDRESSCHAQDNITIWSTADPDRDITFITTIIDYYLIRIIRSSRFKGHTRLSRSLKLNSFPHHRFRSPAGWAPVFFLKTFHTISEWKNYLRPYVMRSACRYSLTVSCTC